MSPFFPHLPSAACPLAHRSGSPARLPAMRPRGSTAERCSVSSARERHAHARNSLRQSLHFLRRRLGPGAGQPGRTTCGRLVRLRCDVSTSRGRSTGASARAVALYRADLLEGFFIPGAAPFEQWLAAERARLRRRASRRLGLAKGARRARGGARRWGGARSSSIPRTRLRRGGSSSCSVSSATGHGGARLPGARDRLVRDYELEPSPETTAPSSSAQPAVSSSREPPARALASRSPSWRARALAAIGGPSLSARRSPRSLLERLAGRLCRTASRRVGWNLLRPGARRAGRVVGARTSSARFLGLRAARGEVDRGAPLPQHRSRRRQRVRRGRAAPGDPHAALPGADAPGSSRAVPWPATASTWRTIALSPRASASPSSFAARSSRREAGSTCGCGSSTRRPTSSSGRRATTAPWRSCSGSSCRWRAA